MRDDTIPIEGLIADEELFDLDLTDAAVNDLLEKRIDEAEKHWYDAKNWNLKAVYKNNKNMWLPNHLKDQEMYNHEVAYQDPRIFVATETLISQANARVANPEVTPGSESVASHQLGKDLQTVMLAWCREHNMKLMQRQVTRGVLINRHAYLYLWYDANYGTNGDVCAEYVSGEDVLVDPHAKMGQNPRFFIRNMKKSIQELIIEFPAKEQAILDEFKIKRGTRQQLGQVVGYRMAWFTYYDQDDKPCEGIAWKLNKLVLGKMKNPNWNETGKNFLQVPLKPFIPMNFLNLGDSYIDDTSLIEQAAAAQRLLDKRGKQAAEITDQASGGLIFNSQMIKKKEGIKLTGHPKEKIFVDGDVRSAVVRLAPADISPGIIADKEDARSSIDNTFGTHAPTRGETSGNKTLGQDQLQNQQDLTRNDELIRAIDQFFHDFFNYLAQMFTVYFTDDHWFSGVGEDGQFDRIAMNADKIEDGCSVYVEPGSTLPIDKAAMRDTGLALAKMQLTDPLSLFEDLGLPNPTKRFNRLVQWLTDPKSMIQDLDDENFDRMAFMDMQILIAGETPKIRNEITDRYVGYFTSFIKSGDFTDLDTKTQKAITTFLQKEVDVLKAKLALEETTLPTPQEMQTGNQQAVDQAQQQGAIASATPQDPAAAAMASAGGQGGAPAPAPAPAAGGAGLPPVAPYAQQVPVATSTIG